jgi:hypothetical protein
MSVASLAPTITYNDVAMGSDTSSVASLLSRNELTWFLAPVPPTMLSCSFGDLKKFYLHILKKTFSFYFKLEIHLVPSGPLIFLGVTPKYASKVLEKKLNIKQQKNENKKDFTISFTQTEFFEKYIQPFQGTLAHLPKCRDTNREVVIISIC